MSGQPGAFRGTHWSDEWDKDRALAAELTLVEVGSGSWGRAVEVRIASSDKKRVIVPLQWLIAPDGAIYQGDFGANHQNLALWTTDPKSLALADDELLLPPLDSETGEFNHPEQPAADEPLRKTSHSYVRDAGATTTSMRLSPNRDLVKYSWSHQSGHFTTLVWQRGIGLVHLAQGSGAHQDGWSLSRLFMPVQRPGKSKLVPQPDIAALFALLPADCLPELSTVPNLRHPPNRDRYLVAKDDGARKVLADEMGTSLWLVDRRAGWLSISSNGDGEGQALEAAVWKHKDGRGCFIALVQQQWTAGPGATEDARLYEWRDNRFRLATFSDWRLPESADFFNEPADQDGSFIAGDYTLPQKGTSIVIRPPLEDDADMLGPETKSEENFAFEMKWDGTAFDRVTLPRQIPPRHLEPQEWIFQTVANGEQGALLMSLFLRRETDLFTGELRAPGRASMPVRLTLSPDGKDMKCTVAHGKVLYTAESATFTTMPRSVLEPWVFESDLGLKTSAVFHSLPQPAASAALPRFSVVTRSEKYREATIVTNVLRFDGAAGKRWQGINDDLAAEAARRVEAFRAAIAPLKPSADHELSLTMRLAGRDDRVLSLLVELTQHLDNPPGQHVLTSFNYHPVTGERIRLRDLCVPGEGWQPRLLKLAHQKLAAADVIAEGQTPLDAEHLERAAWSLDPGNSLAFYFAIGELGPGSEDAVITLSGSELYEEEIFRVPD